MNKQAAAPVDFEKFMTKNVAQLMGFAKPYVGSLTAKEVEPFLANALALAESRFRLLGKKRVDLLTWWDLCLRDTALTRKRWKIRTFDGWKFISGNALGQGD